MSESWFERVFDAPTAWALDQTERNLNTDWEVASTPPGQFVSPPELEAGALRWLSASVPSTLAMLSPGDAGEGIDARDHWFRLRLPPHLHTDELVARRVLCFDGLATLADVWVDQTLVIRSDNMFVGHACDVTTQLAAPGEHVLWLCFRALRPVLQQRRSRGRWPTRLVSQKHLRFVRTSLLGYMPGWYPELPVVGPWRPVRLVEQREVAFEPMRLRTRVDGTRGVVSLDGVAETLAEHGIEHALLRCGGAQCALTLERVADGRVRMLGELRIEDVRLWWPQTHGEPALHDVSLVLHVAGVERVVNLGRVGFRTLEVVRGADGLGFGLRINGRNVFCRGACWSPLNVATVHGTPTATRHTLEQARDAGFNMLRVGGTMAYESDAFYSLCDELGILLWQDFMFANFDYPVDDPAFMASCEREARQLLDRVGARCSLVVLCGGSEVQQQAAMMGVERAHWSNALFDDLLPRVCREALVDAAYVPSSPSGGAMPFHVHEGVGHYYGVGAYLRPLDDVRIANVRFASECLAFSNPPQAETLRRWLGDVPNPVQDARYRASVPRDPGAGWDFADVSDHYVDRLFGVNARELREVDPKRYLHLSGAAVGEAMSTVMHHLRREDSTGKGALVWMLRDPSRGASWGLIDADGVPKAVYYYLKRACAPRALWFSDEGVNGLVLHADNERSEPWTGRVELSLYREDGRRVEHVIEEVSVAAFGQRHWNVEALLGHFVDANYAYRFGPAVHRVVGARWLEDERAEHDRTDVHAVTATHWLATSNPSARDATLSVRVENVSDGEFTVHLASELGARCVALELNGALLSDNYFDLMPGVAHRVQVRLGNPLARQFTGAVRALHDASVMSIGEVVVTD